MAYLKLGKLYRIKVRISFYTGEEKLAHLDAGELVTLVSHIESNHTGWPHHYEFLYKGGLVYDDFSLLYPFKGVFEEV